MKNRIKFTQHSTRDTSPRTVAYAIKSKEDAEFYTNTANAHKMNHRQTFRRNICYLDISKYNYKNLIFIYSKQTTQKAMNCPADQLYNSHYLQPKSHHFETKRTSGFLALLGVLEFEAAFAAAAALAASRALLSS